MSLKETAARTKAKVIKELMNTNNDLTENMNRNACKTFDFISASICAIAFP